MLSWSRASSLGKTAFLEEARVSQSPGEEEGTRGRAGKHHSWQRKQKLSSSGGMKQRHGPLEGWKGKEHFCIGNLGPECVGSGGLDENDPQ